MVITYFNYLWDIDGISAGSAIKAKELIRALRELGHTVHLEWRTPQPNGTVSLKEQVKNRIKPYLQKYLHEPKRVALNVPNLLAEYRILRQQNPDVFFNRLELYNFSGLLLSQWLNLPYVVEADCPPTYEHMNFYGKEYFHLGGMPQSLELKNLHRADAVIAISKILKQYYVDRGIEADKIFVIPNGADPEKFKPREKPADLVKRYQLEGKTVIGWIGALVGWNGIEILAAMAKKVLAKYENVAFMMVGGGANQEFLDRELRQGEWAQRVILPGTVPHSVVPDYLACMDIVIAPYPKLPFWYPSSMKVFEYMSAGKAVVASRVGQIAEVISEGENGVLFDPDDQDELLAKISLLIENEALRQKVGDAARQDVLQHYTWEQHAKTVTEIFENVLQKRKTATLK